jgi:hypothetical protein
MFLEQVWRDSRDRIRAVLVAIAVASLEGCAPDATPDRDEQAVGRTILFLSPADTER